MDKTPALKAIPVADIELDRANPRIRKFLEMYGDKITPEQIYLALGAAGDDEQESSATFEKLKNSILTNGSIIQPVILNKRSGGGLVCVEGNTRVALYQSFVAEKVKGKWTHIPALVYDDMTDVEIDAIRLQVHLVGTRPWDPYSKAKYLHYLRTQELLPFERIVEFSGGRKKEIVESIAAYSDMEQYYRPILPDDSAFDTRRFSGFVELQKPGIKEAIVSAGFTVKDFSEWIHNDKLAPLNTIRMLPRILKNPKAKEAFLKRDAKAAAQLLERPDLSKALSDASLGTLAQALTQAIYALPWKEARRLRSDPASETAQLLSEAAEALSDLMKNLTEDE
jgi:hypothetical protein